MRDNTYEMRSGSKAYTKTSNIEDHLLVVTNEYLRRFHLTFNKNVNYLHCCVCLETCSHVNIYTASKQ